MKIGSFPGFGAFVYDSRPVDTSDRVKEKAVPSVKEESENVYDLDADQITTSFLAREQTWATTNCDDSKTCQGSYNCSSTCANNCS